MNKKIFIIVGVVLLILILGFFILGKENNKSNLEQTVFEETIDISKDYLELRILTDSTLMQASQYKSYDAWDKQMTSLLVMWDKLDKKSKELEKNAEDYSEEKLSFNFLNVAQAVTTKEINDVFDKAPAGKKIRTLAKFLGVDAQRAYKILKQTQDEVQADAWNEAGDEFQKLETAAVVIKDGCKVAGFVGGVIISGGTSAIVAGSAVTKVAIVVAGADLVLEVSEDAANIGLGNNNSVSAIIGDARKITEPAAAILTIANLPSNLATGFDKFNAFMFGLDNFRSAAQEGKVIGIALPVYEGKEMKIKIDGVSMDRLELEEWLEAQGYKDYEDYLDGLFVSLDDEKMGGDEQVLEEKLTELGIDEESEVNNSNEGEGFAEKDMKIKPSTVYSKDGKVSISLESPLDAEFLRGQARMWKLNIQNFFDEKPGLKYSCDWRFYNNGALISEQLENSQCHFTTTAASKEGILVMKVDFNITQGRSVFDENDEYVERVYDLIETISLSEEYTVKSPVDNYRHP